jgi:hypothetical protein
MPKIIFNAVLRRSTDTNDQKQEPIFLAATSDLTGFK